MGISRKWKILSIEEKEDVVFEAVLDKVYTSIPISSLKSLEARNKVVMSAKLCNLYKLAFNYSAFGVTCYFYKKHWINKLDLAVSPFHYGQPEMLSIKERKKLKFIFGSGGSFIESIFRCVLNAHNAGVLYT